MAGQAPEKPRGSRILRRVESLMNLDFLRPDNANPQNPAPATALPPPAPPPTPAAAATTSRGEDLKSEKKAKKEKKLKKDKNEKKEQSKPSHNRRFSMQSLSALFSNKNDEEELLETLSAPVSPTSKPTSIEDRGSVRYTTKDQFKIREGDLKRYPVTVCTYKERDELIAQEKLEADLRDKTATKAPRLPTLQELFGNEETPPPVIASPKRVSVIYNEPVLPNTPALVRTPSMVEIEQAAAALDISKEKKDEKKGSTAPRP